MVGDGIGLYVGNVDFVENLVRYCVCVNLLERVVVVVRKQ